MIYYIRDEEGSLIGIKYNNNIYYYIKNLQEDIIGITDNNYNVICTYEYDSWGRIISIKDNNGNIIEDTSHIGIINPYRYRSYYYDKETKLYYLNSRYYNPEWGRFINSDNFISTGSGILGYNMFSYCDNNFVVNIDTNGQFFNSLVSALKRTASSAGGVLKNIVSNLRKNNNRQNNKAKNEIEAVQRKYEVCPANDSKFGELLKANATKMKNETKNMNFVQKSLYFAKNVNDGAKYDLKLVTKETIHYDGMFMEPQDIGNYHFGYIGRAIGFNERYLLFGASINQASKMNSEVLKNCFTTSLCDDPRDQYFIRLGAIAYDRENKR